VRRIHRGAQKIVKDWLRKFINTNIKIWQYIFDWWRLYWQRKINLRKKSPKSYICIYIYIYIYKRNQLDFVERLIEFMKVLIAMKIYF
jgi:hypothetical protein